jgi:hypothetical protein
MSIQENSGESRNEMNTEDEKMLVPNTDEDEEDDEGEDNEDDDDDDETEGAEKT